MLQLKDFYDDKLLLRQVKRAVKKDALQDVDDDDDSNDVPRKTQRGDPGQMDDDDDEEEISGGQSRRRGITRTKREKHSSQNKIASTALDEDEDEDMDG